MTRKILPVKINGEYGYCDVHGRQVVPSTYSYAAMSSEGVAVALNSRSDLCLIDSESGAEIVQLPGFETAPGDYHFRHGLLPVKKCQSDQTLTGYISTDGTFVIEPQFALAMPFDRFGAIVKVARTDQEERRINRYGQVVGRPYLVIRPFHPDGEFCGARIAWGTQGAIVINGSGEALTERVFDVVWQEHECFIPVVFRQGCVGWIDTQGKDVMQFESSAIGNHFESGVVPVEVADEWWGLMNTQGEWTVPPEFGFIESVGRDRFMLGHRDADENPVVFLSDSQGNRFGAELFELIGRFDEGIAQVWRPKTASQDDEVGESNFINEQGELLLPMWS